MNFEEILEKHAGIIKRTLVAIMIQFEIRPCDQELYKTNALSELWINAREAEDVNASFIMNSIRWSCFRTFKEAHMLGNGKDGTPEIELFSEEMDFSEKFCRNYNDGGLTSIGGVPFPELPELVDLDRIDLAVIEEFLNTPVEYRSRRQILRRRVDLILLEVGIDSSEIHEYTSRKRSGCDSGTE